MGTPYYCKKMTEKNGVKHPHIPSDLEIFIPNAKPGEKWENFTAESELTGIDGGLGYSNVVKKHF